jgi:UDP-N-acetylmuramoylalanine--D-glutamate ligase
MKEAVEISKEASESGAVVLSPGCASFDMFDNFNNRGEVFKNHVLEDN